MNSRPMAATSAAAHVDTKPCKDAPTPATEPTGSIAMAPKLETVRQTRPWCDLHHDERPHGLVSHCGDGEVQRATPMNTSSAECEISRMPRRSTSLELRKAATPMKPAHSANMAGMILGRWKTSAKICCTMATYAMSEPNSAWSRACSTARGG